MEGARLLWEEQSCCGRRSKVAVGGVRFLLGGGVSFMWEDQGCCGRSKVAVEGAKLLWEKE